jgi:ribose/xylose/arabinose/galactoside ABC-type transport system permease subunit
MRKLARDDAIRLVLVSLISAPPIAFMTFDFMFPNISTPSFGKSLLLVFLMSVLTGMPSGYLTKRTDLAMVSVFLYTAVGYALAALLYSAPYTIYNLDQVLSEFYYAMFFRFTIILIWLFVLGGFMGTLLGQMTRDWIRREETGLTFEAEKKG